MDLTGVVLYVVFLAVWLGLTVASLIWLWRSSPFGQTARIVITVVGVLFGVLIVWPLVWLVTVVYQHLRRPPGGAAAESA